MKNKKQTRVYLLVLLGMLICFAIIFFVFRFSVLYLRANTPLPQVLIHKPLDQAEVSTANGTLLHATARAEKGVSRIELWVDGKYITSQDAPDSGAITPLILNTFWQPKGSGLHEIVIRAYDPDQIEGRASILVNAIRPNQVATTGFDPIKVDDTGEPSDGGETQTRPTSQGAGDETASYSPAGPGEPPADNNPHSPLTPLPNFQFLQIFQFFGGDEEEGNLPETNGLAILRLEALSLETDRGYEGVHCYVGLGGRSPQWYPDSDGDQSTDENFSQVREGEWNIDEYLAEENGIITSWSGSDPIPFEINCIGYASDGTEAIDLGWVEASIPLRDWDGVTRQVNGSAEGGFTLSYRIGLEERIPKELNPDIPPPFNLRIDDRRQELQWEWDLEASPVPVDGFLIYVNDSLVFRVDSDYRAARLPYAWFYPPCDTSYRFTLRAYQIPYPSGDFSEMSQSVSIPAPDDPEPSECEAEFVISFDTLITGDLEGDNRPNNWANLVGPISGSFFANEKSVLFEGIDLLPNQTYALNDLTSSTTGSMSHFVYGLEEGQNLRIGFDLAEYLGWDGFRDICTTDLYHDYTYNQLRTFGYFEDTILSAEDSGQRCKVNYTIRPWGGSSFGAASSGLLPLPWIDVIGLTENPDNGTIQVQIQNTGSAMWANQDLSISLLDRGRGVYQEIHRHVERTLALEVGESKVLNTTFSSDDLSRVCVSVDPDREVLELYEYLGTYTDHASIKYCIPRPDLTIEEISYEPTERQLLVKVRNRSEPSNDLGSSDFNLNELIIRMQPNSDSRPLDSSPGQFGDRVIRNNETVWLSISISPEWRERMQEGYTVTLDPQNRILETDEDNNSFTLAGGKQLRVEWDGMFPRWYPNLLESCHDEYVIPNDIEVWMDVYTRTEFGNTYFANWHWEGEIAGTSLLSLTTDSWDPEANTVDIFINPEENLVIDVRGEQDGNNDMGSATAIFTQWDDFGIMDRIRPDQTCDDPVRSGTPIDIYPQNNARWSYCGSWRVYVNICELR